MNYYYCPKCFAITTRESSAKKIKSYCDRFYTETFIKRIDSADELAVKFRKEFLKNAFDLGSFKGFERGLLESAFEQGAKVVFNRMK